MRVGFGKTDISPPPDSGGEMDLRVLGFWYERALPYGPVHDPLCARAAAFASGGEAVCLVSVDMIGDAVGFGALARERIERSLGLPGERVMVVCTHSHTTPETAHLSDYAVNPRYVEWIADGIVEAARQAMASLQPCTVSLGETRLSGAAYNRSAGRSSVEAVEAIGPEIRRSNFVLDETLRAASARTETGAEAGVVVNFACHPVCVQAQPLISADYPGFAMRAIEERGGVALFTNGACGDVDPTRMGTMEAIEWVGGQVAQAAEVRAAPMMPVRGEWVRASRRSVLLRAARRPISRSWSGRRQA